MKAPHPLPSRSFAGSQSVDFEHEDLRFSGAARPILFRRMSDATVFHVSASMNGNTPFWAFDPTCCDDARRWFAYGAPRVTFEIT